MKKFLSILLCLILVMSIFSVGFAEDGAGDPADPPAAEEPQVEPEETEGDRCCPPPPTKTLTMIKDGEGTIVPDEGSYEYPEDTWVDLSADPAPCWKFVKWTGDIGLVNPFDPTIKVKMSRDRTITAHFKKITFTLKVMTDGPGDSSIEGEETYDCNEEVTIYAIPYPCAEFTGWSGDVPILRGGLVEELTVVMDQDREITAHFDWTMYPLTLSSGDGGHVEPYEGTEDQRCGTTVGVVAIPDRCHEFVGWRGDVEDPLSAETEVYMDGAKTAHAIFQPIMYPLTLSSGEGGHVEPYEGTEDQECGTTVGVVAIPDRCFEFVGWGGGDVEDPESAETEVFMEGPATAHAVFAPIEYELFVGHNGEGGTVPSGASTRLCGERVDLVARPAPCWEFTGWRGPVASPGSASTYVIMEDDTEVYANFDLIQYNLGVSHDGNGTVTPPDGVYTHTCGTVVELYAEADECWRFDHWEGDVASSGSAMTTVTMDDHKRVEAVFERCCSERYTLDVFVYEGEGTTVPSGTSTHLGGTEVDLLAIPEEGWHFVTWRGGPVTSWTTEESSVVILKNTTVAAVFAPNEYTLTVTHEGDGMTIPSGASARAMDEVVELTASPASGWLFNMWEGPVADPYDPTTTVGIVGDTDVRALFYPEQVEGYCLCISIEGNGDTDPEEGEHIYPITSPATVVDLDVDPDSGWYFSRWEGPDAGDIDGDDITMDGDKEITAVFRRRTSSYSGPIIIRHTLTITIEGNGTTDPLVGSHSYNTGTVVDLGAEPATGWTFAGWFGPDGGDVTNDQITMSQSKSIIARFETTTPAPEPTVEPPEIEIPLTETPLGGGELPDTGHALPVMNLLMGIGLFGIGFRSKKNKQ